MNNNQKRRSSHLLRGGSLKFRPDGVPIRCSVYQPDIWAKYRLI
jgi:hypothetical protein